MRHLRRRSITWDGSIRVLAVLAALLTASCAAPAIAVRGDVSYATTTDGVRLTLEHFPPVVGTPRHPRPVLVCPGVLANRRFFELEGDGSLPKVLSRAGFDVWLADLRGRPGTLPGRHGLHEYDLDDLVRYDVDTLVSHVLRETGAKDVAWVGHSLGGMIAYGRMGALHESRIGALATLGAPGLFAPASLAMLRGLLAEPALSLVPAIPVEALGSVEGHLGVSVMPNALKDILFSRENMSSETFALLEEVGVSDGARGEFHQFARSVRASEFVSADGTVSYTRALSDISVPALVIVGRADELADPAVGREVFDRLGSLDKEFVVAGRAEGFSADFGHVDLVIGAPARHDIFPRLIAWLARHDGS